MDTSTLNFKICILVIILLDCLCASKYKSKLLVVSFDGFRWDYTQYAETPNFDKFERLGSSVKYMNGVFPTKTFPSHYSIATGLHPESHGIVGNYMYDADLDLAFSPRHSHDPRWWNQAEPIWVTARKQGVRTGVYFWVASTIELHGHLPHFWRNYAKSVSFKSRVDTVIDWFTRQDVDFAMLYFSEPDATAHDSGTPEQSRDTAAKIRQCDATVGYLMGEIERHGLSDELNVIIVSDHGMADVKVPEHILSLADYVSPEAIRTVADQGALCNILPKHGQTHAVYNSLKYMHPNVTVYLRDSVPHRFHFKKHARIHPIVIIPDEGWLVVKNASEWGSGGPVIGAHGYDNELLSMKPFFRAMGPNFKQGFESKIFNQTDLYPLMCEILGIEPEPNNGTLDVIGHMLCSRDECGTSGCDATRWTANHRHYAILMAVLSLSLGAL